MIKILAIALTCISTTAFAGGLKLSGDDVRQKIVGNTIIGAEDGSPYAEYLLEDGNILGQGKDGNYKGVWKIRGNRLCLSYEDDDGKIGESEECSTVVLNGDQIIRKSDDGDEEVSALAPGNPKNLKYGADDSD
jgi:hypothetical protein